MSIQAISQITGFDRETIRKYLLRTDGRPAYGPRPVPVSKLESFKLRELRQRSYSGSYTIMTDWLRPQPESAGVTAVRRFETPPGEQAQVDWGHQGSLSEHGRKHPAASSDIPARLTKLTGETFGRECAKRQCG